MWSKAKSLVRNHWKKVVYGGIAFQVASYGLRYATKRVLNHHQDRAKEVWIQMKKHEHFEKTHANAVSTYLSLLPLLRDKIVKCLNSEVLTASLKDKAVNKLEIWEELKCIAFSRMLASIYASSLLSILLHIQLSVMGGYLIQDCCSRKVNNLANDDEEEECTLTGRRRRTSVSIDEELQREYLALSDYFVQEGMEKLCTVIYEKTKATVGSMPLSRKLTVQDLEQTIWHIIESLKNNENVMPSTSHNNISHEEDNVPGGSTTNLNNNNNNNPVKNAWKYIFPPTVLTQYDNFRRVYPRGHHMEATTNTTTPVVDIRELIMTETFDLLQSQDVEFLMTSFETFGVSSFLDRLVDIVAMTAPQNNNNRRSSSSNPAHLSSSSSSSSSQHDDDHHLSTSTSSDTSTLVENNSNSNHHTNYILPHEVTIPLAKLIPLVNNFFPDNLQPSNPWITSMTSAEKLRDFSANVYESFSSPFPL